MRLIKIGRDVSNDIVLRSDKASSLHAEITLLNNGDMVIEDKGSSNGTYLMNQRINPGSSVKISRGDHIRFADVDLVWSQVPMPEDNSRYVAIYGIGSHLDNDIHLTGSTVSRYHATVKVGRDKKVYIIDHSKNGTTVDGVRVPANNPVLIKKKSSVVCGGVPVNLDAVKWPANSAKTVITSIAAVLLLGLVAFGGYWWFTNRTSTWNSKQIYARYNTTTVMLIGMYHFEVECGNLDPRILNSAGIPTKFFLERSTHEWIACGESISRETIVANNSTYEGTGFFISEDGKLLTNLHVVKPWLFDNMLESLESELRQKFAKVVEEDATMRTLFTGSSTGLSAYISQLKVKGISDGILLIPQGSYVSSENSILCHALSAGNDISKDVALIQSDRQELPNKHCTYVNVTDSMRVEADALSVGSDMFTIGFPHGSGLQTDKKGLQVFCHPGHISQAASEFAFTFDAVSYHGASGSPVFNDNGMLIGILHAGVEKENINEAIKAQYIKELLDSPYKVE